MKNLLSRGVSPDSPNDDGLTALHQVSTVTQTDAWLLCESRHVGVECTDNEMLIGDDSTIQPTPIRPTGRCSLASKTSAKISNCPISINGAICLMCNSCLTSRSALYIPIICVCIRVRFACQLHICKA